MIEDAELLKRFADEGSEEAFAELVRRRVDLVYSVALRHLAGDVHLAQDVTQQVFVDLAKKARALSGHAVISGWLYRSTQFAASRAVRTEQRRRLREQEAERMKQNLAEQTNWEQLRPLLDEAMGSLPDTDRDAVALRFFEARSFAEIGRVLRVTEEAARKRVERALEKLHALLLERGVGSTAAALGGVLAGNVSLAAPAGLAAAATSSALAASGGAAGFATFLTMTKLQSGIAATVVLASAIWVGTEIQEQQRLKAEIDASSDARPAAGIRLTSPADVFAAEMTELRRKEAELPLLRDRLAGMTRVAAVSRAGLATAPGAAIGLATAPTVEAEMGPWGRVPVPRFRTPPTYPQEMRRSGIGGDVLVEFTVNTSGEVVDVRAVRSTRDEFENAAVEAVRRWEFRPGYKDEETKTPANTRLQVQLVFRMENNEYELPRLAPVPGATTLPHGLAPFRVTASTPKPGEVLPLAPKAWF